MSRTRVGVDIGGSGVKVGLVDVDQGSLVGERLRLDTPEPATPEAVASAVARLVAEVGAQELIGVGFPAVVKDGVVYTANNIHTSWIGVNAVEKLQAATGSEVRMINDADAAALAEASYGSAKGVPGTVVVLTFGTGIGSGVLHDGRLVRNVELGMLEFGGCYPAELKYSAKARKREKLDWDTWGKRVNDFVRHVDEVLNPNLIVVGGGVSRKWGKYGHLLDEGLPVVPAGLANNAGIIGAAALAI